MTDLEARLAAVAQTPVLLVATDFDGTIAPIVAEPGAARPNADALRGLYALAAMPHTHVALISGRARSMLTSVLGDPSGLHLVGSHGLEFDPADGAPTRDESALLNQIESQIAPHATSHPAFLVERKPLGIAFHFRRADPSVAMPVVQALLATIANLPGVVTRRGALVIEFSVRSGDKGGALAHIRHRTGATAAVFFGDDQTDEDAFALLHAGDVSVKVGDDATRAEFRVPDTRNVAESLLRLAELRRVWLDARRPTPIHQHALLSDQRTLALATPAGRITWLCLPRVDSSALFAELVGGPAAGYFEVAAANGTHASAQRYDPDTFVLTTSWPDFSVCDYLDCSGGRPFQRSGRTDLVRVIEGRGRVVVRFAPRLDFGRMHTRMLIREAGLEIEGTLDPITLYAPGVNWKLEDDGSHHTATATIDLDHSPVVLELRYGNAGLKPLLVPETDRRRQTSLFWRGWAGTLALPTLQPDLLRRSALVLKALCYGPTGAICAAATSSLPEHLGGMRNWDYRFCWPRDAAMAAAALVRLGNSGHALKLLDWLLGIVDECVSPEALHPIYTVHAGHLPPEAEVGELSGYGGSRPVRISNGAANQVQLDVFGPIVDLAALLGERGAPLSADHWRLVKAMVLAVERRWQEPDHGIWEFRGQRKHHTHSKVMCWHSVNQALVVAAQVLGQSNPEWITLRDAIADDVLRQAWNPDVRAFTGAYGETWLDAAVLQMGLCGLLPAGDPRFVSTVEVIEKHLRRGPTVYRYVHDDGLPGREGGFHLCTGWLVESLLLIGQTDRARRLFDEWVALAGPLGLFAEQYEPDLRLPLGNFPQAYSHLAIINAAVRLSAVEMPA